MRNIKITLLNNKRFTLENKDELVIPEYETDETLIEVEYPSEYKGFLKRVEFLNIRKERYTLELSQQDDNPITFTIPKEMALRGELKMQFVAYLLDDVNTLVPFHIVVVTIKRPTENNNEQS